MLRRQLLSARAFEDRAELTSSSNCFTLRSAVFRAFVSACKQNQGQQRLLLAQVEDCYIDLEEDFLDVMGLYIR